MKIVGVIPVRYDSSRLKGKPLASINGKPMVQRVYEQVKQAQCISNTIIATDDNRIFDRVKDFTDEVVLTHKEHLNGTSRCFEASEDIACDYVMNIQGDQPYINPAQLDELGKVIDSHVQIATLCGPISDVTEIQNPNIVKVIKDVRNNALYFSRAMIPYSSSTSLTANYLKHIGVYCYRKDILKKLVSLAPCDIEIEESLEQLRWLVNGFPIRMVTSKFNTQSVDTLDDLKHFEHQAS
ncbi:MAG: 3-deoxy-manno-octulosonate cytidylyltransferase [Cyclobacteriaceae bacterium]